MAKQLSARDIERAYHARIFELSQACQEALDLIRKEIDHDHPLAKKLAVLLEPDGGDFG